MGGVAVELDSRSRNEHARLARTNRISTLTSNNGSHGFNDVLDCHFDASKLDWIVENLVDPINLGEQSTKHDGEPQEHEPVEKVAGDGTSLY